MKKFAFILLLPAFVWCQSPQVSIPIIVSDQHTFQTLSFGYDPAATDALDGQFGELELPPLPPTGVFDARFLLPQSYVTGTLRDYRSGSSPLTGSKIHRIKFQRGTGTTIVIRWDLPAGIVGLLSDLLGGLIIQKNMSGKDSLVITQQGINEVQMTINYTAFSPQISAPVPVAPQLYATGLDSVVVFCWSRVQTATSYRLQISTDQSFTAVVFDDSLLTDTLKIVTTLRKNRDYFWRVWAKNNISVSPFSAVFSFSTRYVINWANLQQPGSVTIAAGDSFTVAGRALIEGRTPSAGQTPGLEAWIGYSTSNTNPTGWSQWIALPFHGDNSSMDEFRLTSFGKLLSAGTYYFATRFRYEAGGFIFGGYSTSGGGFWDGVQNVSGTLTVTVPPLRIVEPDNGALWTVSTSKRIRWVAFPDITHVKLEYSTNAGTTWEVIAASLAAGTGSYVWSVPNNPAPDCRLRLTDIGNPLNTSVISFTIKGSISLNTTFLGSYSLESLSYGSFANATHVFIADALTTLKIFSVTQPQNPQLIGTYSSGGQGRSVTVQGNHAYISAYQSGLRIVDISNPSAPSQTGFYDTPGFAMKTVLQGNYAFVADLTQGMRILDISNLTSPQSIGTYVPSTWVISVAVQGNYAFVARYNGGAAVLDVSVPSLPVEVATIENIGTTRDVDISGSFLYVVSEDSGLIVYDITNPVLPVRKGKLSFESLAIGITVKQPFAYVSVTDFGVRIVDIQDPLFPVEVGYYNTPGSASATGVYGDVVFAADYTKGLQIFRNNLDPGIINTPTNLVASSSTPKKVRLDWTDNANNETGYVVERAAGDSTSGNTFSQIVELQPNAHNYIDTLITDTTQYSYRVKAVKGASSSSYSNTATVMTLIPVELTSLSGHVDGNTVVLNWETSTEKNNHGYEVERNQGEGWLRVGFVKGNGTNVSASKYQFRDKIPMLKKHSVLHYQLWQMDDDGTKHFASQIEIDLSNIVSGYVLHQNFPNPFNSVTSIVIELPLTGQLTIDIYNTIGELVHRLDNGVLEAGIHTLRFDAGSIPSGTYYYIARSPGWKSGMKMIVLK